MSRWMLTIFCSRHWFCTKDNSEIILVNDLSCTISYDSFDIRIRLNLNFSQMSLSTQMSLHDNLWFCHPHPLSDWTRQNTDVFIQSYDLRSMTYAKTKFLSTWWLIGLMQYGIYPVFFHKYASKFETGYKRLFLISSKRFLDPSIRFSIKSWLWHDTWH